MHAMRFPSPTISQDAAERFADGQGSVLLRWRGDGRNASTRDFREAVLGEDQGLVVDLGGLCACGGYMDLQIWIIVVSFSGTLT